MNALQIIPPTPATTVRRSVLFSRVLDAILLLSLTVGMSLLRGEEGTASEPGAAVVIKDSRDNVAGNDKSPVTPPAAAPASATAEGSGGGADEKASVSAQPNPLSATSVPAGVTNDPKAGSEPGKPSAADAKSSTAASASDRNSGRTLAKLSTNSRASVASKNDLAAKSEDARVRNRAPSAMAARSAESVRRAYQPRGEVDYRGWKPTDAAPVWVGPPPIIYGTSPEARAPLMVGPANGMKRQDRMSLAAMTGWVVEAPGAVLNGGKQALYGILDSVW